MSDARDRLERELALLRLENRSLRAHLAAAHPGSRIAAPDEAVIPISELEELRKARSDLRRLVSRLGAAPVGWILRTRPGFRRLQDEWGGDDAR